MEGVLLLACPVLPYVRAHLKGQIRGERQRERERERDAYMHFCVSLMGLKGLVFPLIPGVFLSPSNELCYFGVYISAPYLWTLSFMGVLEGLPTKQKSEEEALSISDFCNPI